MKKPVLKTRSRRRSDGHQERTASSSRYRTGGTLTPQQKPDSARQASHRARQQRRRLALVFLGVATGVGMTTFLIRQYSGTFTVEASVVDGTHVVKQVDSADYQSELAEYFNRHRLQRFRFVLDFDNLKLHLQQKHPEVEQIKAAQGEKIGTSRLEVVFRQPVARWKIESKTYFVDTKGVIFQKNYFDKPEVEVVDHTRSFAVTDGAVASQRTLSFIGQAIALADQQGVVIKKAEIPPSSLRMVQLNLSHKIKARLTVDRAVDYQVEGLVEGHKYLIKQKQSIQYIDVRVPGKVFYK